MPTIPSYPRPDGPLVTADVVLGFADGKTVQIPLDMIGTVLLGSVATAFPNLFQTFLATLPNESNGDAIPDTGPYLSGDGVLKFA